MPPSRYHELRAAVVAAGYEHDIDWAQNVKAPETAEDFASEVIWVILCSGMKEQVARIIQERVWAAIRGGLPVKGNVLGKSGKADAGDGLPAGPGPLASRCKELVGLAIAAGQPDPHSDVLTNEAGNICTHVQAWPVGT